MKKREGLDSSWANWYGIDVSWMIDLNWDWYHVVGEDGK